MNRTDRGRIIRTLHTYLNQLSDEELLKLYSHEMKNCTLCQYKCDTRPDSCKIIETLGKKDEA